MDPAIAARVTASSSSTSSRSYATASPTTSRTANSMPFPHTGPISNNNDDAILNSQITLEQALAAHANARDPARAALEAILQERNTLSYQNSQLWNHLKKQRSNYQAAAVDLKRIRAERESLRTKLAEYEQPADGEHSDERRLRSSHSAALLNASTPRDTQSYSNENVSSESPLRARTSSSHHKNSRDHSEDRHGSGRARSVSRDHRSTNRDPTRGQQRERSSTHPEFSTPPLSNGSQIPSSPTSSEQRSSNEHVSMGVQQSVSPPPLKIPHRADSLPSMSSDASSSQQILVNGESLEDPLGTAKPTVSKLTIPSISAPTVTVASDAPRVSHGQESIASVSVNSASVTLAPNYLGAVSTRKASRESRISLPDEAKRYYANLADSPLASPNVATSEPWRQTQRTANGDRVLNQVPEETDSKSRDSASPRPFLELETTDDSESESRISGDTRASEIDPEGAEDAVDFGYAPNRGDASALSNAGHLPKTHVAKSTATVDQFPLPPATYNTPTRTPSSPTSQFDTVHDLNMSRSVANSSGASRMVSSASTITSSVTTLVPDAGRRSRDRVDSFIMPPPSQVAFRQMPLLDTDLKTTTLEVLGSHIRANDKGKEVLSFVIAINVIGKESWQIEKFYSDVLALDSRLRTRCGRTVLKKLQPLPDNKLFKDHAPAKVDQRKQMLQAYLQSVMGLPIKDKNEIIVFFSSDVLRERSPVTKNGYKEGYLTKRGKNFGGWKTRYFVLQGPVLEYYESRGGTHLGSIQISGAQIGRQQKAGSRTDSDDENEFRHAFLIIEPKRGPAGQNTRHVLCAESDRERDAWVDVLVRYVLGPFEEDNPPPYQAGLVPNGVQSSVQARTSSTSLSGNEVSSPQNRRIVLKDQIQKVDATPIPISQLSNEGPNAKFFPNVDTTSPSKSPIEKGSVSSLPVFEGSGKSSLDRINGDDAQLSSSLPTNSSLADAPLSLAPIGQRSNSELGHYPDLQPPSSKSTASSDQQSRIRERVRMSYHPTLGTVMSSPSTSQRPPSPEKVSPATASPSSNKDEGSRFGKISGPLNGTPIPAGYKFGGKDPLPEQQPSNDRERKARSRAFWRWPTGADKSTNVPTFQSRAVFGVPLEESLAVCQIANLPAIVFRSIQYLEAKKADQEEGIYRLSGSSAVIKNLKDRFNAEGDVDLLSSDVQDPHAIAGLLKSFLRELPSSLLTRELHMRFLAVMDFVDTQERIKELQELISQLPLANYSLLRALTAHLILIVQNSNVNKMTMRNVGIVFSPTLGIPAGVFSLMLGEFNRVFNVNGDGSDSSVEEDLAAPAPRRLSGGLSRRNSKRYSDAAADQLLGLSGRALSSTAEDQSDDGDDISVQVEDESDAGDTEAETEAESIRAISPGTAGTPAALQYQEQMQPASSDLEATPPKSRASFVAASRGLNLNLSSSTSKADRRRSRLPQGLPASPRPTGSPLGTPTFKAHSDPSPASTPR